MSLAGIGLSEQETAVYRAMVAMRGPASAVELEAVADVTPVVAQRALAALAGRGLARRVPGRAAAYAAVEPDLAAGPLLRHREEQLALARAEIRDLATTYQRAGHGKHPAELIEVVEGRDNIMTLYRRLVASAHTQMRYFSRPPYFSDSPDDDVQQADRMAEGVSFRVVYDADTLERAEGPAAIRRNVARGERARVTGMLPMEMMIVDDDKALIPLDLETLDSAYLIGTSTLLVALGALFETTWLHAMPFHVAARPDLTDRGPAESDDRGTLLALLAAGLSDKAIQRRLGLSPRTLQRRIQDLYGELGAQNRFQAGVAARGRGWLRPEEGK